MNTIVRTLSFSVLWFASSAIGLGQQPGDKAGRAGGPAKAESAGTIRTLDDIRVELNKKNTEDGGMSEGGNYGGMGGAGMGMGMAEGGYGEGGIGADPTEKQILGRMIQQLRGRLESKKFKRESVEKQLRSALQQYFDADIEERVKEFDKVKARVVEMETKLQRRLDSEREIIELQLKQMLHKADGLEFNIPSGGYGIGGMGGYGGGMMGGGYGGEGYGAGGDMGFDPIATGYDASFEMTRVQRLDSSDMDDMDPLKSYVETQTNALTDKLAKTDAEKLKTLLSAFLLFHDHFNHFPKSANQHTNSQPPHSWRVAILPLIGYGELFNEYQFDQPWDSEQNLQVAKKMPELYRSMQGKQNSTPFMMIVGGGAFDSSNAPPRLIEFTDGTSNTIALIQSDQVVAWTKPEDVAYSRIGPLPGLSKVRLVGMVDGTTIESLPEISDDYFRAMITRAGREPVEFLRDLCRTPAVQQPPADNESK